MAVTSSGLYVPTHRDVYDTTQLAINYDLTTNKAALFTNAITPNFSTDTAYAVSPYNANEVSGTGYTAGGVAVASPSWVETSAGSGVMKYATANLAWTTATFGASPNGARCVLFYADALAGNNAYALINLGVDGQVTANTFTVICPTGGWFTWRLVA